MSKITIIGAGNVGATIAYTLTVAGLASEIVLIDIVTDKALGEALDIRQGTPYLQPCSIYAGDYRNAVGSDIVILTSGVARKPGQSRLDLAQVNVNILKSIIPQITHYAPDALYVIVANPVDILTYTFCKLSGIPENRIIGSGTILDTSRLRARVAEYYNIKQSDVHAYVMGEHGDSAFVPWSIATIAGLPIDMYHPSIHKMDGLFPELNYKDIVNYVRRSGSRIIARKGATFYAIAVCVSHLVRSLQSSVGINLTVSSMLHGEYGLEDVCISTINVLNHTGIIGRILPPLTSGERMELNASAQTLQDLIAQLEF